MSENFENEVTSRREFLKKSLKVAGYSVPVMMALSSVTLNAWASKYGNNGNHYGHRKPRRGGRGGRRH